MNQENRDGSRETIWGINRKDRRLFQAMTLIGGNVGSAAVTFLILKYRPADQTPDLLALSILLGIGASFVASGFIAWDLVQIKEITMAVADWIREATERRRQRWLRELKEEIRLEVWQEAYRMGYADAAQGRPERDPTDNSEQST